MELQANTSGRFSTAVATWTPTAADGGCTNWWKAADYATKMTDDGAGLISSWRDSVAALDCTGTTTARPTYSATSFNSAYPGVTFDGSANALTASAVTGLPFGSTAGLIVNVRSVSISDGTLRHSFSYGSGSAALRRMGQSTGNFVFATDGATNITSAVAGAGNHIVAVLFNGTTLSLWVDGATVTPVTIASLNTSTARTRLGANSAGAGAANFFGGVISDICVSTATTTAVRQKLEGYFAWNRGLTSLLASNHPYKNFPP